MLFYVGRHDITTFSLRLVRIKGKVISWQNNHISYDLLSHTPYLNLLLMKITVSFSEKTSIKASYGALLFLDAFLSYFFPVTHEKEVY